MVSSGGRNCCSCGMNFWPAFVLTGICWLIFFFLEEGEVKHLRNCPFPPPLDAPLIMEYLWV